VNDLAAGDIEHAGSTPLRDTHLSGIVSGARGGAPIPPMPPRKSEGSIISSKVEKDEGLRETARAADASRVG
jgi:hypothetical protein